MKSLAAEAAALLRGRGLGAAWLTMTLLHADGTTGTARTRTGGFVQEEGALTAAALRLLRRVFKRRVRATRLWLTAEKLSAPERQGVLFAAAADAGAVPPQPERRNAERLLNAVNGIRRRYGDASVKPAIMMRTGPAGARSLWKRIAAS